MVRIRVLDILHGALALLALVIAAAVAAASKIPLTKVLDVYGALAPGLLLAAAAASFDAILQSHYALTDPLISEIESLEKEYAQYNWRCSIISVIERPSSILFGTFTAATFLSVALAACMIYMKKRKRNTARTWLSGLLFWIVVSLFGQLVSFTVTVKTRRPRIYSPSPSVFGLGPSSSREAWRMYYDLDRPIRDRCYDFYDSMNVVIVASWIATGFLASAMASVFISLRDKGIQLPLSSDDVAVEKQNSTWDAVASSDGRNDSTIA